MTADRLPDISRDRLGNIGVSVSTKLGVLLVGVSLGIMLQGARLRTSCPTIGGQVMTDACVALAWGNRVAMDAAFVGGTLLLIAVGIEAWRQRL